MLERSERQLAARVVFLREGGTDLQGTAFKAFRDAKALYDDALAAAGYPAQKLLATRADFVHSAGVCQRCKDRFAELLAFHQRQLTLAEQSLRINRELRHYRKLVVMSADLAPADPKKIAGEAISLFMGETIEERGYIQYPIFDNILQSVAQSHEGLRYEPLQTKEPSRWVNPRIAGMQVGVRFYNGLSWPAFTLFNCDRTESYQAMAYPVVLPFMRDIKTLEKSLQVTADTALVLALGAGDFAPPGRTEHKNYGGTVYAANVGQSIVPNYPLAGASSAAR